MIRSAVLAAALLLPVLAWAQQTPAQPQQAPTWTQKTSRELAAECKSSDKRGVCVGYITGIYDLQFAPTPPQGVCPPANLNPENLTAVVVAYAETHDDGPAPAAIAQAIVRFFPCTGQQRR